MSMRAGGQITVFLTLILVSIFALICGLLESARMAGARCYLRTAVNSAVDSVFSQYHRQLWKDYRLLGLEFGTPQDLEQDMERFLRPYLEVDNWYPMGIDQIQVTDMVCITDDGGRYLEQEILDYMKYGIWDLNSDEDSASRLLSQLKEAGAVNEISGFYKGHAKEAVKLEAALEAIDRELRRQEQQWQSGVQALAREDCSGFVREAEDMIRSLKQMPKFVQTYEKRADALGKGLQKSRYEYEEKREQVSAEVQSRMDQEILQYEEYTSKEGSRRQEVERLIPLSQSNIQWIEAVIEEAREVEEYIENWESDDDDELDTDALWEPVRNHWAGYPKLRLSVSFGVRDKEKEGQLEQVGALFDANLLTLLLPEGVNVSQGYLDLTDAPSRMYSAANGDRIGVGLPERLVIGEYASRFFYRYQKQQSRNVQYEMEYLLSGKLSDEENLWDTLKQLLAIRAGLNLVYLLSDSAKREEARNLAMAIVGGTGMVLLIGIVTFFIMGVWALGEALMDLKILLDDGRVPLMKSDAAWNLDLGGLLKLGSSRSVESGSSRDTGLDYKEYLKLLLFLNHGSTINYRMMDVIQMNLRREQEDYRIDHCVYSMGMDATVCGKHVMFSLGLWKNAGLGGGLNYLMGAKASYCY